MEPYKPLARILPSPSCVWCYPTVWIEYPFCTSNCFFCYCYCCYGTVRTIPSTFQSFRRPDLVIWGLLYKQFVLLFTDRKYNGRMVLRSAEKAILSSHSDQVLLQYQRHMRTELNPVNVSWWEKCVSTAQVGYTNGTFSLLHLAV